jgi:hypothetical protein
MEALAHGRRDPRTVLSNAKTDDLWAVARAPRPRPTTLSRSCGSGRRQRQVRRRAAGRPRRPERVARPGPTPETDTPPNCWPTAATGTGRADPARPGQRQRGRCLAACDPRLTLPPAPAMIAAQPRPHTPPHRRRSGAAHLVRGEAVAAVAGPAITGTRQTRVIAGQRYPVTGYRRSSLKERAGVKRVRPAVLRSFWLCRVWQHGHTAACP